MSVAKPSRLVISFACPDLAGMLVAGIPAGARAAQMAVRLHGQSYGKYGSAANMVLTVPGGAASAPDLMDELARLVPDQPVVIGDSDTHQWRDGDYRISGEALVEASAQLACGQVAMADAAAMAQPQLMQDGDECGSAANRIHILRQMDRAGRMIIAATIKAGDGLVSRHINRPISMRISAFLLRFAGVRPMHATALTALCGLVMALCLFSGTQAGLVAGGVLFQIASIVDGVDGEMARATQRTSARGAMMDTVTDGVTNVAFLAGLAFNLHEQGNPMALPLGLGGALCFAAGLMMLGVNAARSGETVTFDAVKHYLNRNPTRFSQILIWIAMRDFFALASMVLILMGFAFPLLSVFATIAMGWLLVVFYIILGIKLKRV